jgi:Tol biopolymer transport system component
LPLSPGFRLGPYEIVSPLGAGGMGEVYRARDTRLERTVAVKVLAPHMSASVEVRQRFEREAKTISQLSHPHICALYDVGREGETEYLVMELLEGETLSERLAKGALPLEQTLRYGIEIAGALDKAHRQGIVHRDLKPGNVMLTKSGVKLLDFGLAKAMAPAARGGSLTALPTQQGLTQEGTILGTFQYMAPEQLEGKEADGRTDIFGFGAVLYEMATGEKAFSGTSQASLISAIMQNDPPPISAIAPMTPPALDRVVKTCLAKDPEERWQSAADIKRELKWIAEGSQAGVPAPVALRRRIRERALWAAALLATVAIATAVILLRRREAPSRPVHLSLATPPGAPFQFFDSVTVSPDGRRLVFVAHAADGKTSLWVRSLDSLSAEPLAATDGAQSPFWSPDSAWIGFFADGKLKKIEASGGSPQVLADAPEGYGGTWNQEGIIVFAPGRLTPLYRVSASGGAPAPATKLGAREEAHRWPSFLPGGERFVFLGDAWRTEDHSLRVGSLRSLESEKLLGSFVSNVVFARPGYLLFVRGGGLVAQRFDAGRARLFGDPAALGQEIKDLGPQGHHFDFSTSDTGTLTFQSASPGLRLNWFDRSGKRLEAVGQPGRYGLIELSPDGQRVAYERLDADGRRLDIWALDLVRGATSRVTSGGGGGDFAPVWSPDGRRILFGRGLGGIYETPSGGGAERLVVGSEHPRTPESWSPDSRALLFSDVSTKNKGDLWILPLTGGGKPTPIVRTPADENASQFSPDGRWLAYVSAETGQSEVYIQAVSDPSTRRQVSTGAGRRPRWRGDGRELFYMSGDKLMAVELRQGAPLEVGVPKELLKVSSGEDYAATRDGQRFLFTTHLQEIPPPPTVVLNWTAGLKR